MFDAQYSKRPETDRSQTTPEQKTTNPKQSRNNQTGNLTDIPVYAQAWGNLPPPWLLLPTPQQQVATTDLQCQVDDEPPTQRKENTTGLPDTLKAGVEQLSGLSIDDVQVHYNSPEPKQVQALAYTQGTDIHVGPGQEKHLAHEAWHAVQQKQGRVKPTLKAKSVTINDEQGLEQEADAMGEKANQFRSTNPQKGESGDADKSENKANQTSLAPLQGIWLFYNHEKRSQRYYFWKEDGTNKTDSPTPTIWSQEYLEGHEPKNYYGPQDRPRRGAIPALDLSQFITTYGKSQRPVSHDTYNPFGRFREATVTSFIPNRNLKKERASEIVSQIQKKDKSFEAPFAFTAQTDPQGYPMALKTNLGKILYLLAVSQLGATYSNHIPQREYASYDPTLAEDPSKLKLSAQPLEENFKLVYNKKITEKDILSWSGKERDLSQKEVMGSGAGDVAENAGFQKDEGKGWEWLHLIAHSMGGIELEGPQVPGNLVAGTSECNTQMIIVEEFLKDLVSKTKGHARLFVGVHMFDKERHIGDRITYDFDIYNQKGEALEVFHWVFDCLSRANPLIAENRYVRYAGRALFGLNKDVKEKGFGSLGWEEHSLRDEAAGEKSEKMEEEFDRLLAAEDFEANDWIEALNDYLELYGNIPPFIFSLLGRKTKPDDKIIMPMLYYLYKRFKESGMVFYLDGLIKYHLNKDFLYHLYGKILAELFGGTINVPARISSAFVQTLNLMGGAKLGAEFVEFFGLKNTQHEVAAIETTKSGNCLYEAVNILLANPADTIGVFRQMATQFIIDNNHIPGLAGLDINAVVHTLSTPGAWSGDAGDLAPIVLASVIQRPLSIVTNNAIYQVHPIGASVGGPLTLYLSDNHYTINPVTMAHKNVSNLKTVDMILKASK